MSSLPLIPTLTLTLLLIQLAPYPTHYTAFVSAAVVTREGPDKKTGAAPASSDTLSGKNSIPSSSLKCYSLSEAPAVLSRTTLHAAPELELFPDGVTATKLIGLVEYIVYLYYEEDYRHQPDHTHPTNVEMLGIIPDQIFKVYWRTHSSANPYISTVQAMERHIQAHFVVEKPKEGLFVETRIIADVNKGILNRLRVETMHNGRLLLPDDLLLEPEQVESGVEMNETITGGTSGSTNGSKSKRRIVGARIRSELAAKRLVVRHFLLRIAIDLLEYLVSTPCEKKANPLVDQLWGDRDAHRALPPHIPPAQRVRRECGRRESGGASQRPCPDTPLPRRVLQT